MRVRIGIDMLALQSPHSRGRGIGRYAEGLLGRLLAAAPEADFLLYAHEGLPADGFPQAANATVVPVPETPSREAAVERLVRENRDGLDWYVLLSPFEVNVGYAPPPRPLDGPRLAAVVYDLVPFIFQERYLTWPPSATILYRNLERLRQYDRLLAISEATRADCLRLLGLPPSRVVSVGTASDADFFRPDRSPEGSRSLLERLGIDRPFVLAVASADWRKNVRGLLDAARLLPPEAGGDHQVVLACALKDDDAEAIRRHASERGLADRLVLTGAVSDEDLRALYQRCAAFASPAFYEGFGLPILEAMHCGAAVVAGNNSSQPEVVGAAGLLANPHDPADIAAKLGRILGDPEFAESLRSRAPEHARNFRWDTVATRVAEALSSPRSASLVPTVPRGNAVFDAPASSGRRWEQGGPPGPELAVPGGRRSGQDGIPTEDRGNEEIDRAARPPKTLRRPPRPRLAVFSPLPPKRTGIADYTVRLVRELRETYAIDLYHDEGYEPDLGAEWHEYGAHDFRTFPRRAAQIDYRAALYQMGNSKYHKFVYDTMAATPGVVTLHDFGLAGLHWWVAREAGAPEHFGDEVRAAHPARAGEILRRIDRWAWDDGDVPEACTRRGLYLNRRLFDRAGRVVVHSPWCLERVRESFPEHSAKTVVIPMGATPRRVAPEQRAATRARFGLPAEALIFASFGIVHPSKLNAETVAAFAPVARRHPEALLLFVGKDLGAGEAAQAAVEHGLAGRVRFLGRQADADFADLIAACDIGICLRRPPTNGETSAALMDLLRHGTPTIVNDAGTFGDLPDEAVLKVRWDDDGIGRLSRAIEELAGDALARAALGESAYRHVAGEHVWPAAAARYVEAIEEFAVGRRVSVAI